MRRGLSPRAVQAGVLRQGVEALTPWLTPALIVALGAWLRADISAVNTRIDQLSGEISKRFDHVSRELGDLREWMARLEGGPRGLSCRPP